MKNCEDEQEAKDTTKLFCKNTMISACLDVPQQNNSYDCGVYVLQFAESFMVVSQFLISDTPGFLSNNITLKT